MPTKYIRYLNIVLDCFKLFFYRKSILFFGGYYFPERKSEGYFQRIAAVDSNFPNILKIHIDMTSCSAWFADNWILHPDASTVVFNFCGTRKRKLFIMLCVVLLCLRYRRIYFHSVHSLTIGKFFWLLRVPFLSSVIDMHGVVPEEFRYHNDFYNAMVTERLEELAVKNATIIICVTNAMKDYLQQKYRGNLKGEILIYPISPHIPDLHWQRNVTDKPIVIYAGGVQKWQQAPLMAQAMVQQCDLCSYEIYTPNPVEFITLLPENYRSHAAFTFGCKTTEELMKIYSRCQYGFILREDIVVNNVACPTKLVEYIATGIVPIVKSPAIGDFKKLNMRYISLDDFLCGKIPDEVTRKDMAEHNLEIYKQIHEKSINSANYLRELLFSNSSANFFSIPSVLSR